MYIKPELRKQVLLTDNREKISQSGNSNTNCSVVVEVTCSGDNSVNVGRINFAREYPTLSYLESSSYWFYNSLGTSWGKRMKVKSNWLNEEGSYFRN